MNWGLVAKLHTKSYLRYWLSDKLRSFYSSLEADPSPFTAVSLPFVLQFIFVFLFF